MEKVADLPPRGLDGALRSLAKQVLELGEYLFGGIDVGAVFGQEEQSGPDSSYRGPYCRALVGTAPSGKGLSMITISPGLSVGTSCVSMQMRNACALTGLSDTQGATIRSFRSAPMKSLPRTQIRGHRVPVACGRMAFQPLAIRPPSSERGHVGLCPGLVHCPAGKRSAAERG